METYLPIATLVLGALLNEALTFLRGRHAWRISRTDRWEQFQATVLAEALITLNTAYQAAAAVGLETDVLGTGDDGTETRERWLERKPLINACGSAAFDLDRLAVLLPAGESPRVEIEAMAQATVGMTVAGTHRQLSERWKRVDPAVLAARQAVGVALRELYTSTGSRAPSSRSENGRAQGLV